MKKIAVVCALGMGDALILSIATHHLGLAGWEATTCNAHIGGFGRWLNGMKTAPQPPLGDLLPEYEAVLVQHDNTARCRMLVSGRRARGLDTYVFYTNYRTSKHGPLVAPFDFPFNEDVPMVANTIEGTKRLFRLPYVNSDNGFRPPQGVLHRRHLQRIAIHPTSADPNKDWLRRRFFSLAERLRERGYMPCFLVSPRERSQWLEVEQRGFALPLHNTLEELATTLYESGGFIGNSSGLSHIASLLKIPHAILSPQERNMRLWQPGWLPGTLIHPPKWIPNIKGLRLKEQYWKHFITVKRVLDNISFI